MVKIILVLDGKVLKEMTFSQERITIGRRPHNDIAIDDGAISSEHAVIVTLLNESFIEDLNSTNGIRFNSQRIKKHLLQNGDVIDLARYQIKFFCNLKNAPGEEHFQSAPDPLASSSRLNIHGAACQQDPASAFGSTVTPHKIAAIKILNGPEAGRHQMLTKALTSIGSPGVQVAVITRRSEGYCITHVEGEDCPLVNGKSISTSPYPLKHNDIIELSGTRLAFLLP